MSIRRLINKEIMRSYEGHTHPEHMDTKRYNNFIEQTEREMMRDRKLGYDYYKALYESTKPIRGRAEECRPIGQRRRDWETIEHRVENGQDIYSARLYNTDVVQYYPDGGIKLVPDSWFTPLTADFMHTHSPFFCYKKYNKLWVRLQGENDDKHFPIPSEGLMLIPTDDGRYEPRDQIVIKQKVVDRVKAKQAREPMKPFLAWTKAFLSMSDGWIMAETKEQIATPSYEWWRANYDYGLPEIKGSQYGTGYAIEPMYQLLIDEASEDKWLHALCIITDDINEEEQSLQRIVKTEHPMNDGKVVTRETKVLNKRFTYERVKNKVYKLAEQCGDIYKEVEVEVTGKAMTKII